MSEVGFFIAGCFIGASLVLSIRLWMSGSNVEEVKAKTIVIEYSDGKEEKLLGTEWDNFDDVVSIYNNELEDNLVKEINSEFIKSIGFVKENKSEVNEYE